MDIFFLMNSLAGGKKGLRECKFQKGLKTRLPCPSPSPRGCSCPLSRWKVKALVTQSCLTPCDPMHCSPPGFSVHGDSPGKNIGVGCHALLQGIFLTQGLNPGLLHCRKILYHLSHHAHRNYEVEGSGYMKVQIWKKTPGCKPQFCHFLV